MSSGPTRIRLIEGGDAEPLAAQLARDEEAFERWEPFRPAEFFTPAGQHRRIERLLARHTHGDIWPGVILAGQELIGQITVQNIEYGPVRGGSLGYSVATTHQGQGHATRAVGLVLELMAGELRLHRAQATTQLDNVGSQHVLASNGFSAYGVAHSQILLGGLWRDVILWERLLELQPPGSGHAGSGHPGSGHPAPAMQAPATWAPDAAAPGRHPAPRVTPATKVSRSTLGDRHQ